MTGVDVARSSLLALIYRLGGMVFWLVAGVITARAMSVADRGVYSSAVVVIAATGGVGANFAASAGYFISNQKRPVAEVLLNGLILSVALGIFLLGGALVFALFAEGDTRTIAIVVGIGLLPEVARNAIAGIFLALNSIGRWSVASYGPALLGSLSLAVWVLGFGHRDAVGALAAWVTGQYLGFVVTFLLSREWWAEAIRLRPNPRFMRSIAAFGSFTGLVAFVALVNARAGQLLVATLDSREGAGIFASSLALADGVSFVATAVTVTSYGHVAALSRAESAKLTARAIRNTLLVSALAALAIFVLAPIPIRILYGDRYEGAITPLRILAVGAVAFAPRGLFVNYFTVQLGKPQAVLVFTVIAAILNLALSVVLIPSMGYSGAAWAATIAYVLSMVLVVAYFLANAPVRSHELWRVTGDDVRSYVSFARQVLSGRVLAGRGARADADP